MFTADATMLSQEKQFWLQMNIILNDLDGL